MDDVEKIKQLSARYNIAFDTGDIEAWTSCWTESATLLRSDANQKVEGHDALRAVFRAFPVNGIHITNNFIVEVSGDEATSTCYFLFLDKATGFTVNTVGIYTDEVVRTEAGWKYQHRYLDIIMT